MWRHVVVICHILYLWVVASSVPLLLLQIIVKYSWKLDILLTVIYYCWLFVSLKSLGYLGNSCRSSASLDIINYCIFFFLFLMFFIKDFFILFFVIIFVRDYFILILFIRDIFLFCVIFLLRNWDQIIISL
jgi:hypothetical protein